MANPQAEQGHVDIANEIMEALARISIPSEARRVLDFILRKTYGWHKKEDAISLTQFEDGTGLRRSHVCRSIQRLIKMNLIYKDSPQVGTTQSPHRDYPITTYGFQKDFERWVSSPNTGTSPQAGTKGSPQAGNRVVPVRGHTKETIQKKTNKRKVALPDEEFWKELRSLFHWVDIDREVNKMKAYMLTPKGRRWRMTQQRVVEWLGRIDRPLNAPNPIKEGFQKDDAPPWIKKALREGWKV